MTSLRWSWIPVAAWLGLLVIAVPPLPPSASAAGEATARRLRFDVFLDERPIGEQVFELSPADEGFRVAIRARFELSLLGVKALDYDHRNRELWRRGCLFEIESRTTQNGKAYRVVGRAEPSGFAVEGEKGRSRLPGCIRSFAYWDKGALLSQRLLLNSQTGEHVPVEIRSVGGAELELGGRTLAVDRYRIEGKDLEIEVAYTRDGGEWVALDSPLFLGRTLRYRRDLRDLDGGGSSGS